VLKDIVKFPVFLFCVIALCKCIDPYYPQLDKYESLLVVEGLVTDEKIPYEVRLSRTFKSADSIPEKINDATVFITDESGNVARLVNSGDGIYKTDSALFSGQPGKTYSLHIETSDGKKYLSEPCVMLPVPEIDTVYYFKDEEVDNVSGNYRTGIMIYLDCDEIVGDEGNLRWEYEETWKFKPPNPKRYDYVSGSIVQLDNVREYCWKTNNSGEILTHSVIPGQTDFIKKEPVLFIPSGESDRLTVQYSILIKQYSVSSKEFGFWNNLKQVNETSGGIFDTQPYPVISNIYNTGDPEEKVLGYFKVSAVKQKRIYITPEDIKGLNLPQYINDCIKFVVSPEDYPPPQPWEKPITFDDIYNMFMAAGGFIFVEPVYDPIYKLVFAPEECSDCSLTGSIEKPDFWIDLP
jgi:hypothetical protein